MANNQYRVNDTISTKRSREGSERNVMLANICLTNPVKFKSGCSEDVNVYENGLPYILRLCTNWLPIGDDASLGESGVNESSNRPLLYREHCLIPVVFFQVGQKEFKRSTELSLPTTSAGKM